MPLAQSRVWMSPACPKLRRDAGFSLAEILIVIALVVTVTGIAVPQMMGAMQRYRTRSAAGEVAAQIRAARLAAVTTNRQMIVRFNCPVARAYRFVEVTGDPAIDALGNAARCSMAPADADPATLPNADGSLSFLPETITFNATQDLRISTTGVVTPLAGGLPASIGVTNGAMNGQITVTSSGRVTVQ